MPPELLSILTGALPELGTVGIALVVLEVFRRQVAAERAYFTEERTKIRAEAAEDVRLTREQAGMQRAELLAELRESKAETREAERREDELRARMYGPPQTPATTTLPPVSRHRAADGF